MRLRTSFSIRSRTTTRSIKRAGRVTTGTVWGNPGYRLFGDLGVVGTTCCHWIAYLNQYIEAAPPTDYPGGQYPVDHAVFIIDNGNGWAFSQLDMKPENRDNAVIKSKGDLAILIKILEAAFQTIIYVLPTPREPGQTPLITP